MKKILIYIFIIFLYSCSNDYNNYVEIKKDNYYVKYKYSVYHIDHYIGYQTTVWYTNNEKKLATKFYESRNGSRAQKGFSDEFICGPFNIGDTISLYIRNSKTEWETFKIESSISVRKNNEPFIEKCKNKVLLEYIIK